MLKESIADKEIPGAVALVARKGKIVYFKAFGMADAASGRAFQRDDIFRIASQTKAITSTAVMMLWEEGKFRLDDPISQYIPEFANAMVLDSLVEADSSFLAIPATEPITIRHLITHTSGIGYGFIDDDRFGKMYAKAGITDAWTTENILLEDNIPRLAKLPCITIRVRTSLTAKGSMCWATWWRYSRACLLTGSSGNGYSNPLGWKIPTSTCRSPNMTGWCLFRAMRTVDGSGSRAPFYDVDYPIKGAKTYFSGGGGLCSTIRDYANFLQMYLNQGELNGIRLLSRTTVNVIMANQIGDIWKDMGAHHGLAFQVLDQKIEDAGGQGSAGTFTWGGTLIPSILQTPRNR
jgi:CubicO group peptidase (beta-lactamase class C family)